MYRIRSAHASDVENLQKLASLMQFINLPPDPDELTRKCHISERAFAGKVKKLGDAQYLFVLEEFQSGRIVGTSSILAQHGTPREPHMYLEVAMKNHYSKSIGRGFVHEVLRLQFNSDGPTEIGGLVLDPSYRQSDKKLGRLLSFVRFCYIGIHPERFRQNILAELLPPFLANGSSVLWESLGRKFTHMTYHEADRLSRQSKEFITSLFPKGDIYVSLLPGPVRDVIGMVGPETQPVKHMLEKIGFRYKHMVDPFDGGPHYWAETKDISIIKKMRRLPLRKLKPGEKALNFGLICSEDKKFFCTQAEFSVRGDEVFADDPVFQMLECQEQSLVWLVDYESL